MQEPCLLATVVLSGQYAVYSVPGGSVRVSHFVRTRSWFCFDHADPPLTYRLTLHNVYVHYRT